ncbi:MAG: pyridoxamine 5'-phosphate oxidase family protein [Polyangiales bacterium]
MERSEILAFLRSAREWVEATVSPDGAPQAAVVGVAVTDELELVFDTVDSSRKCRNLRAEPRVALTMWNGERTAQIEGVADEPKGEELARVQKAYFAAFPDGPSRLPWPGLTYVRVRPTWIRISEFVDGAPRVTELTREDLRASR